MVYGIINNFVLLAYTKKYRRNVCTPEGEDNRPKTEWFNTRAIRTFDREVCVEFDGVPHYKVVMFEDLCYDYFISVAEYNNIFLGNPNIKGYV